ncbi:hypothetical protein GF342_06070 [Candidatus Woesearchaeota archaeon]|nr:hypothetical protein [Candidatus Woesearchaeota archaeon]
MELADQLKAVENELKDLLNWVSVFEDEYDLDKEVVDKLKDKLRNVAEKVGNISC